MLIQFRRHHWNFIAPEKMRNFPPKCRGIPYLGKGEIYRIHKHAIAINSHNAVIYTVDSRPQTSRSETRSKTRSRAVQLLPSDCYLVANAKKQEQLAKKRSGSTWTQASININWSLSTHQATARFTTQTSQFKWFETMFCCIIFCLKLVILQQFLHLDKNSSSPRCASRMCPQKMASVHRKLASKSGVLTKSWQKNQKI